jgi:hypothetical protein
MEVSMRRHPRVAAVAAVSLSIAATFAAAQDTRPGTEAESLARAWSAIAQGRTSDAVAAADDALRRNPRSHDAIGARIAALAPGQPIAALDGYESWLSRVSGEDIFLLDPIARGVLGQIAQGNDVALRVTALEHLAAAGSESARARLQELRASTPAAAAALARNGDAAAGATLVEAARTGRLQPDAAAELLPAAGPAAVPALTALLKHSSPAVRADAIRGLGRLRARDAAPQIRAALADPHPLVSNVAALALTRLRDPEGEDRASRMLESEVADVRLMAAEAFAERGQGPWVAVVMPLLQDPNGLTRLTAAELVAPIHPDAARAVLLTALKDPNPVIRAEAARTFSKPSVAPLARADLSTLRSLLRDSDPGVRLHAASVIVELTFGKS